MPTDRPPSEFDAVAAAEELGDLPEAPSSDAYVATLESEIEQLTNVLAQKDLEVRRAHARADQAHAEIEAVQRRVAANAEKELAQRTRKLLESLLPVVDDLDRTIAAVKTHAPGADLLAGVELVRRQMLGALARYGVTPAPALGQPFDPNRHEAIAVVPVTDPAQDKRVLDVQREGYSIGDTTLRPASVAVGKYTR